MSPGLAVVLIIVVWLLVLAPVLLRSQRPMSRTGEAFEETRVLFSGDSDELATRPNPKLAPKSRTVSWAVSSTDSADREATADAHDHDVIEVELEPAVVVAVEDRNQTDFDVHDGPSNAENATIDGEIVADDEILIEDEFVEADASNAGQATTHAGEDTVELALDNTAQPGSSRIDAEDDSERSDACDSAVFTAPAVSEVSKDAYEYDHGYVSPVDLMYPGAVDSHVEDREDVEEFEGSGDAALQNDREEAADSAALAIEEEQSELADTAAANDEELTPDELKFAQSRVGRGGWDPAADAATKATRFQRRQRTLFGLAIALVVAVGLGVAMAGAWWTPAVIVALLTVVYLVALRQQVKKEHQLRARRIAQLRRARLGVRSAVDEELAIPRALRRPGAIIIELDDDSPDFDHLPYIGDDSFAPDPSSTRGPRRDDLAVRRAG
ncbi:MAG: hypothetical protein SOW59_04740 [Corynebacterium sp.]|nr:hypothetical protein [Corynebacterium sp.]